jgi:hypothetical protein
MHGEAAERLFREYLESQGWRYWTESEFRRALGLNKACPAPDFTLLDDTGAPVALVEVSQFTGDIDALIPKNGLTPVKTSQLPLKVRKKANQLRSVLQQASGQLGDLPTMLALHDPFGAQTHRMVILQRLLGLAQAVDTYPLAGKVGVQQLMLTPEGQFFRYAPQNAHLSAVAALRTEEVFAHLSGLEREVAAIGAQNFEKFSIRFRELYEKHLANGVPVDEEVPVLEIFQNPAAQVQWLPKFWGQYDRVWGLIDPQTYGLVYNGLLVAHAGVLTGGSLPDPVQSARASGFYDE